METTLLTTKIGGSIAIILPKVYCEHINIEEKEKVIISDAKGKQGNFIALWKK